jgi:predicted enzyme related to lactoylglutathione lyase
VLPTRVGTRACTSMSSVQRDPGRARASSSAARPPTEAPEKTRSAARGPVTRGTRPPAESHREGSIAEPLAFTFERGSQKPFAPSPPYDNDMLRLRHVAFACENPRRVAEFWAAVLGYEAGPNGVSWQASDPRGEGPQLMFIRSPKSPTIELPIHLDVNVPDREAEVQRIIRLGARGIVGTKTIAIGTLTETCTIMRDPEGNGFCVQGPDPRKDHPYIGNVTFSSAEPPKLGAFWSQALGWPAEEIDEQFLQMLREAHLDPLEFEAYYAIRNADGSRPRFLFQRREKSRPESYPIHLDFRSDDRERDVERLKHIGADVVETKHADAGTWTVLRDPEGNPFYIV